MIEDREKEREGEKEGKRGRKKKQREYVILTISRNSLPP